MIIVDASIVIDLVLSRPGATQIAAVLEQINEHLVAPELLDLEVLHVLRREARRQSIDEDEAKLALSIFEDLSIERFSHGTLRERVWQLRHNLTAYDAAYFALAELLDAPLWTRDHKFQSVPGHEAVVNFL